MFELCNGSLIIKKVETVYSSPDKIEFYQKMNKSLYISIRYGNGAVLTPTSTKTRIETKNGNWSHGIEWES